MGIVICLQRCLGSTLLKKGLEHFLFQDFKILPPFTNFSFFQKPFRSKLLYNPQYVNEAFEGVLAVKAMPSYVVKRMLNS